MKVKRRFRVYPTLPQQRMLAKTFGCVRKAFNDALDLKEQAYKNGEKLNFNKLSAALTASKKTSERAYLNEVSCVPLQQALRHLDTAYVNFFQKRAKHPRHKSKYGKQAAEFTASGFKYRDGQLSLAKIGALRVVWSCVITGTPSTVTITKDCAGRYFVTLTLDEGFDALPETGKSVGVDLGITSAATFSDGRKIENPHFLKRALGKLAKAQRVLARKTKRSGRWNRQKLKVAKIHAHVADARKDFLNKLTTGIVREFDVIAIEDLNVKGMAKSNVSQSVLDVGFYEFRRQLEYKCLWYGRELRMVDRWCPTTKTCSACGIKSSIVKRGTKTWTCPDCGTHHDRDANAAINILAVGQTVIARGERVNPKGTSVPRRSAQRNVNQPALCSPLACA